MHSSFLSEKGSEVYGSLWWSWSFPAGLTLAQQSMTTSWPHTCTCSVLCCAYLQKTEQGYLSQKSTALPPYGPFLQPHSVLAHLHSMFLPAVLGWSHDYLVVGVWDMPISPLSSGLLQYLYRIFEDTLEFTWSWLEQLNWSWELRCLIWSWWFNSSPHNLSA